MFVLADDDYLAAFQRDPASGTLTQTGCAESSAHLQVVLGGARAAQGRGMAVSSDARSLYVANQAEDAVLVFAASVAISSRAASVDRRGRFRVRLACPAARVRGCAGRLRVGAGAARAPTACAPAARAP